MTCFRHFRRFAISGIIFVTIVCSSPESSEWANPESFWNVSDASGITRISEFEDAKFKLRDSLRRDMVASIGVLDGYGIDVYETWPHCKAAIAAKLALSGIIASQSPEEAGPHAEVAVLSLRYLTDIISDPARIGDGILTGAESRPRCQDFENQRHTDD